MVSWNSEVLLWPCVQVDNQTKREIYIKELFGSIPGETKNSFHRETEIQAQIMNSEQSLSGVVMVHGVITTSTINASTNENDNAPV
jgi:hypothetical protein